MQIQGCTVRQSQEHDFQAPNDGLIDIEHVFQLINILPALLSLVMKMKHLLSNTSSTSVMNTSLLLES
jgi:hypothetical protein